MVPAKSAGQQRLEAEVAAKAAALRVAEQGHRAAAQQFAEALLAARESGSTWTRLTEVAGLNSPATTRMRAQRAKDVEDLSPSLRWRVEFGSPRRQHMEKPGISISEAARRMGISRNTVYARIKRGQLESVTDGAGHPRVLLDED